MTIRTAYRRRDSGERQPWAAHAVLCAAAWLICAAGFAGLALKAGTQYVFRPDLRLLLATRDMPDHIELILRAQSFLTQPLLLAACIFGFAALLLLRGARVESLVVLAAFALFGVTVVAQHLVQDVPPYFSDFGPYERLLASNYFPSGRLVGVTLLSGLVFIFAERVLGDVMDTWLLRLTAVVVACGAGPLQLYAGVHKIDVAGAYLLVAMFLLPVAYAYGRPEPELASKPDQKEVRVARAYAVLFDS